ncbi:MAG: tetratricopeptide repeat protein, partial [Clostridia bacterium]
YSKENADINYLIANAYFEKEEYQNALIYYNNAVSLNQSNPLYFRDLAITLARTGDREKAESKLLQAKELGLEEPSALLVSGELLLSKGEYNNAISEFNKVINKTDDNEIIFRAYILSSDAYKKNNDINNQISLLETARKNLPVEYQNPILISLANAYSLKSQQNSDEYIEFAKKALDVNLVLYQNGYQSESLLINLSNLYQRLTQFDNALKVLTEAKDKYPESYKVFLRLAFLETDIQSKIEENKRDYTLVANYYNTAKKYYKTAQNNGVSDPEMKKLETIIAKLKEGKWL